MQSILDANKEQIEKLGKEKGKTQVMNELEAKIFELNAQQDYLNHILESMKEKALHFSPDYSESLNNMIESLKFLHVAPATQELLRLIPQIQAVHEAIAKLNGNESEDVLDELRRKVLVVVITLTL
jgi:hypothetical protein